MAVGVGVIGVVGVVTLLAVLFKGGGTGTGGTGTGTGTSATMPAQGMVPLQPQRPLKVTIRENDYMVNGRPVDLVTLTELAQKVPAGSGPALMIERSPSSRAKAENDLKDALNKKQIPFASD
jgi:hypothetical protein